MRLPLTYLGTHKPGWLGLSQVPLFVSQRTLGPRRSLPRASCRWALDSGGFSELSLFGRWETTPAAYVEAVRRYQREIGGLDWAAIQDWMCEPFMLQRTGLSMEEHQRRTVESFLRLRDLAPEVPWAPVLQGFERDDYQRCFERYDAAGVDLRAQSVVGLGSVCRRQATAGAVVIVRELAAQGLRLHGFGFKVLGLLEVFESLASSDSLAWSYDARRADPMPGHPHQSCANCRPYAERWLARMRSRLVLKASQVELFERASAA